MTFFSIGDIIHVNNYLGGFFMPHITIKMLKGRTDEQKTLAGIKVADALAEAIGCDPTHISVSVEDFTPLEWQDVFKKDVTENDKIVLQPDYDPKSLLK